MFTQFLGSYQYAASSRWNENMNTKTLTNDDQDFNKVNSWMERLLPVYGEHGSSILGMGKVLHDAKLDLRKEGLWTKFLKSDALPISKRKAEMLVRVWSRFNDVDAQTFAHFPQGWSIVYELTMLEQTKLEALVEDGTITPRLTLTKAKELTGRAKERKEQGAEDWLAKIKGQDLDKSGEWAEDDRVMVANGLSVLAGKLQPVKAVRGLKVHETQAARTTGR